MLVETRSVVEGAPPMHMRTLEEHGGRFKWEGAGRAHLYTSAGKLFTSLKFKRSAHVGLKCSILSYIADFCLVLMRIVQITNVNNAERSKYSTIRCYGFERTFCDHWVHMKYRRCWDLSYRYCAVFAAYIQLASHFFWDFKILGGKTLQPASIPLTSDKVHWYEMSLFFVVVGVFFRLCHVPFWKVCAWRSLRTCFSSSALHPSFVPTYWPGCAAG